MNVNLTPDQQAFIRDAMESGRLHGEEDAVREAMELWEARERARAQLVTEIDSAETSIARGNGRCVTEQSMKELAEETKQRGRARLAAEKSAAR